MDIKICLICNKKYYRKPRWNLKWWATSKYCSQSCSSKSRIGKPSGMLGKVSPMKGRKHTIEAKEKNRLAHLGKTTWNKGKTYILQEKHWAWKGDEVGYRSLHHWIEKLKGKPTQCEFCKTDNLTGHQIHWANKSQQYKRDLSDWLRLCVKCHRAYDKEVV